MKLSLKLASILLAGILQSLHTPLLAQGVDTGVAEQPARTAPEWLKSGVIYEVFTNAFSPEGTLNGITARLDNLHEMGVNVIWLMPINPAGQVNKKGRLGSPYAVRDYYAIDPALGTNDDLHRLVQEAHRRQMKVILDVVLNHTAWDNVLISHPDFYKRDSHGQITYPYDWTDVAALDYDNPQLWKYMTDMLVYWVRTFDIDGYRCDTAGSVPTAYWEHAREALEKAKPDIMMLAEASKPELLRKAFDIDYAWPSLFALNDVMMHGAPANTLRATMQQQHSIFPRNALHLQISDDHDELRAVTRFGYAGATAAYALTATLDGAPLIYNGNEVADSTQSRAPALFGPDKIYWPSGDWHPDTLKFYAAINALRKQHPALQQGQLIWVNNSDEQHVLTYLRRSESEEFLVAVNLSTTSFRGTIEVAGSNWDEIRLPGFDPVPAALPALSLENFGVRVFRRPLR